MIFNCFRISELTQAINELDSATQWASSGQLQHAMEIDPSVTPERAQAAVVLASKNLYDAIAKLVAAGNFMAF